LQLSRTTPRDPAIDLSGPKAPGESLTPRSNSAVADAVDLQFDFFSSASPLGSRVSSGRTTSDPESGGAGMTALSEGMMRCSDQNNHDHALLGFPPCKIEGVDGEGWTPSSSPPCPLPTTTSTSGCWCECIWLASPPSTSPPSPS